MANIWDERKSFGEFTRTEFRIPRALINWQLNCENYLHAIRRKGCNKRCDQLGQGTNIDRPAAKFEPNSVSTHSWMHRFSDLRPPVSRCSNAPVPRWFLAWFQAVRIHGGNRIHVGIAFKLCNRQRSRITMKSRSRSRSSPWIWHGRATTWNWPLTTDELTKPTGCQGERLCLLHEH